MSLTSFPSSRLITRPCHLNLASLTFSAMSTISHLPLIASLCNVFGQLFFISSYYSTCPCHLNLASLTFSAMSTISYLLLISSFHNVSDQLSFISFYYVSIPSQPCFPHLLRNVYHLTSASNCFII